MNAPPPYTTTWEEGRYVDRWMVVHFLSGLAGGFSNVLFMLPARGVWVVGLALLLLWEGIERVRGIHESWQNVLLDPMVGAAGIACALAVAARVSPDAERVGFALSATAFIAGSVVGWLAYRRRHARDSSG